MNPGEFPTKIDSSTRPVSTPPRDRSGPKQFIPPTIVTPSLGTLNYAAPQRIRRRNWVARKWRNLRESYSVMGTWGTIGMILLILLWTLRIFRLLRIFAY